MDKVKLLKEILEELERRGVGIKVNFLDDNFPKQFQAAKDQSILKAIQCTRRAGKSTGEAKETLQSAFDNPETKHLYGALTLGSAKNIIWDMFLSELELKKIQFRSNEQQGIIKLANKSEIRLFGLDSSYKEMRKILGGKYKTVKIDEAGSITQDLKKICLQMILPALTDMNGRLTLLGTAENIPKTYFEAVTSGLEPGWSVHKWTAFDNPYIADKWKEHIEWIEKFNPTFKLTSEYKTHYLNEWCADDRLLIIRINKDTVIPAIDLINPTYILGVDLGYNDDCSFVLTAFHARSPELFVVEAYKENELDITDTANRIKDYLRRYPVAKIIVDGANKQGVMEMRNRHNIPLEAAKKEDKASFLKIMADDVTRGRIRYFQGKCDSLIEEQEQLQWKDVTKQDEDPRIPNHCFVAGTMVLTIDGYKAIEKIDLGEMVLTRAGFMPVMVKHESITNQLCVIKTINGEIECTPSHKFMTSNGWLEAENLTTDSLLYILRSCLNQKNLYTTKLFGEDTQTLNAIHTENIGKDFIRKKFNIFIGIFGKSTTVKFYQAFMYTTKITTITITLLRILRLLANRITPGITWMKKEESRARYLLKQQSQKHPNGTLQKMVLNGIKIIGTNPLVSTWIKKLLFNVKFAESKKKLLISTRNAQDGAAEPVPRNTEENQELITSKEIVSTVTSNIQSINTSNPNFVLHPALLKAPTKKDSVKRVYNLTVKDHHEYVVSGFLVKNCNDAMLYSWREARNYLWKEQPKPEDINSNEYMDQFAKRLTDFRRKQNELQY